MRAVVQRVREARVEVAGAAVSEIGPGLLILLGVETGDTAGDREWLCRKIANLRIFQAIVVSQFTLLAATKKGNRPSYIRAARPEEAVPMYEAFVASLAELTGRPVGTGEFGADMQVHLVNDGPVTITIDSRRRE